MCMGGISTGGIIMMVVIGGVTAPVTPLINAHHNHKFNKDMVLAAEKADARLSGGMEETVPDDAWSLVSKRHLLKLRSQRTVESYTLRALSYKLRGESAKQFKCLNKALAKDPNALVALYMRAMYHDLHGATIQAIADFERCLAIAAERGLDQKYTVALNDRTVTIPIRVIRQGLALAHYHNSEYEKADKLFSDMLHECKDQSDEAEVYFNRGLTKQNMAERSGDVTSLKFATEAVADYNEAIKLSDEIAERRGWWHDSADVSTSSSSGTVLNAAEQERKTALEQIKYLAATNRSQIIASHPELNQ